MKVDYILDIIALTRTHFLKLIESCDLEKINKIPQGFGNNLIWNFAHVMASMQMLCYERCDLTPRIGQSLVDAYKPETFPEKFVDEQKLTIIKEAVMSSVDMLRADYKAGVFKHYNERKTRYGIIISDIDEAITYISTHESLHFGYAKALVRVL